MSPAPHTPQTAPGITVATGDAEETRALGARLARLLRAGDLVMLSGGLGAGKTTLAQGIGAALKVRGRVSSPTFIIARVHPALAGGPDLIHVDAYRITSLEEIDALDLDSSLDRAVTLVEWGEEKVEALSPDRLEIQVMRPHGAVRAELPQLEDALAGAESPAGSVVGEPVVDLGEVDDGNRTIIVRAVGPRWADVDLSPLGADASRCEHSRHRGTGPQRHPHPACPTHPAPDPAGCGGDAPGCLPPDPGAGPSRCRHRPPPHADHIGRRRGGFPSRRRLARRGKGAHGERVRGTGASEHR